MIAGVFCLGALLATAGLIFYYVADTSMNATRRVREFLTAEARTLNHKANMDNYYFHAYRIGQHAWGVSYAMEGMQPRIQNTCFVNRHHRVFHPESKALSELLKEELQPRRGDEAFIDQFLLSLNGEPYTVLKELPGEVMAKLALDAGEKIRPPEWIGNHTHRFYTHQEIGGYVYRCVFHYGEDGNFQTAEVTRLGDRVKPWGLYQ